ESEVNTGADLYYYSDFQQNAFAANPDAGLAKDIRFHGIPVQEDAVQNIYIDTAYIDAPVLQTGQSNRLVVHSKKIGKLAKDMPVLQLLVIGQVKCAATPNFNDQGESIDTLSFQVNDARWQKIALSLNDAALRFDDTFRIS